MIKFTVPADFKNETIDKYIELNNKYKDAKVYETYGQITVDNPIGSGRAYDLIPEVSFSTLKSYINYTLEKGIDFNYTLNSTCLSNMEFDKDGLKTIVDFLFKLKDIGVTSVTVEMTSLMELINSLPLGFTIKASTVCQITNSNKAMAFKKLGVEKIVLDESINRDFESLKRIRNSFGPEVELITNVICHKNCIYEMFHHNQTSHDSGVNNKNGSATYYSHRCMMKRCENASNLLKLAWIRPEDVRCYEKIGIDYYKIQGRQAAIKGDMPKTVEAYMKGSFTGNLVELLDCFSPTNSFIVNLPNHNLNGFIKPFFTIPNFCKNDCDNCNYCSIYMDNNIETSSISKTFEKATTFYKKMDEYKNEIEKLAF